MMGRRTQRPGCCLLLLRNGCCGLRHKEPGAAVRPPSPFKRVTLLAAEAPHAPSTHGLPPFELSAFVQQGIFAASRAAGVDNDECLNWNEQAVQWLVNAREQEPIEAPLREHIRHGVPDYLKPLVWLRAQRVSAFLASRPDYYQQRLNDVFGGVIPDRFDQRVPTFTSGFLGLEEKIVGSPIELSRVEGSLVGDDSSSMLVAHGVSWTQIDQDSLQFASGQHSFSVSRGNTTPRAGRTPLPLFPLDSGGLAPDYEAYRSSEEAAGAASTHHLRPPPSSQHPTTTNHRPRFNLLHFHSPKKRGSVLLRSPSGRHGREGGNLDAYQRHDLSFLATAAAAAATPSFVTQRSKSLEHLKPPPDNADDDDDEDEDERLSLHSGTQTTISRHVRVHRAALDPAELHTLESVTHLHHLLTPTGFIAAKRILWLVNETCADLEFNPLIPSLVCLSLVFLDNEAAAFVLLLRLVETGRKRLMDRKQAVFLTLNRADFVKFVKLVKAAASKHLPRVLGKLEALGVDVAAWIARSLSDGLATTVSFNVLTRIYTTFIFEGARVLQRYLLAILKVAEADILRATDAAAALAAMEQFHEAREPAVINALTKAAFRFTFRSKLSSVASYDSLELPTPYLVQVRMQRLYRPRVQGDSSALVEADWAFLWTCLPAGLRLCDPVLRFRSDRDGTSMTALRRRMTPDLMSLPTLLVIRTGGVGQQQQPADVLGAFGQQCFGSNGNDAFVFALRPEPNAYFWTGSSAGGFAHVSVDLATNIGIDDAAIWFDGELLHGRTAPSASFASPALLGDGEDPQGFEIGVLELWTLE